MEKTAVQGGMVARSNVLQDFSEVLEAFFPCYIQFFYEWQLHCLSVETQMLLVKFIQLIQIESDRVHLLNQLRVQARVDM